MRSSTTGRRFGSTPTSRPRAPACRWRFARDRSVGEGSIAAGERRRTVGRIAPRSPRSRGTRVASARRSSMTSRLVLMLAALAMAAPARAVRYRIDTFAGGGTTALGDGLPATFATLDAPTGLARDVRGKVYIADHNHDRVRRVRRSSWSRLA